MKQEEVKSDLLKIAISLEETIGTSTHSLYTIMEHLLMAVECYKKQFERNRLEHCKNITQQQYDIETKFVDEYIEKHNRLPTILDAIEITKADTINKACDWFKNNANKYIEIVDGQLRYSRGLIRDFRKAMEE